MHKRQNPSTNLVRFTFITTPMLDCDSEIEYLGGRIIFRRGSKAEIWAFDRRHAYDIAGDLVVALQDYDPHIEIKLLHSGEDDLQSYHPSDPSWAYSMIPLGQIPKLRIQEDQISRLKHKLQSFEAESTIARAFQPTPGSIFPT